MRVCTVWDFNQIDSIYRESVFYGAEISYDYAFIAWAIPTASKIYLGYSKP